MSLLRAMQLGDLAPVLKVINQHDEDDGESAEADYQAVGLEHQYVLEIDGQVQGVTGYREVAETERTAWLSWTYLSREHRGQGHGKKMLQQLLSGLKERGARKVFAKVSDYQDPEQGNVYQPALKLYQSLGFELELTSHDFYDADENQLILGLDLSVTPAADDDAEAGDSGRPEVRDEKPCIRFNGLFEIAETDDAYSFSWTVEAARKFFGKRSFSVEDLQVGLQSAKDSGGRKVFLTFPSNLPLIHQPLQAAGFKYIGKLIDYYEPGVDEMHFVYDLADL